MATEIRTRKQIAHAAGVSEKTISRWVQRGLLPAAKPGGRTSPLRIEHADLLRLLKKGK